MKKVLLTLLTLPVFVACGKDAPTFSLAPDRNIFKQNPTAISNKIDILWVMDNSGSMATPQSNVANNFNAFINNFVTKNFDFKMAVTTTDAYKAAFGSPASVAKFRDGSGSTHSGYFVLDKNTPNLVNNFMINITQGTSGSGDERAFSSFKSALNSSLNAGFLRPDSFLAIIIVSDEDDFSWSNSAYLYEDYNDPRLHTVQSYVDYLDTLTGTTGALRRYNVSTISVLDAACLAVSDPDANIGIRYMDIADKTNGVKASICSSNFAASLDAIQNRISELSTQFFLTRVPNPATIRVFINDISVPNDGTNGWTYNSTANSIVFHGSFIPQQGATIAIDFDPVTIKQ